MGPPSFLLSEMRRTPSTRALAVVLLAVTLSGLIACGGGRSSTPAPPPPPTPAVKISPTTAAIPVSTTQPFFAYAMFTNKTAVTWTASAGNVDESGLYTAPASQPSGGTATVTATSVSSPSVSASATVTITTQPVAISLSPQSTTVKAGFSHLYLATVTGTTNTAVSWAVTDMPGDFSYPGSISNGRYTAPSPVYQSDTFLVTAVSTADQSKSTSASVTVVPLENQQAQDLPIKLGTSGINANSNDCCTGTLGSLLTDQSGKQYILSNNHILGRVSHAVPGEDILQPGLVDAYCDTTKTKTVAKFTAATPIAAGVDAAVAEVVPGAVDPQGAMIGLGGVAPDGSYLAGYAANTIADPVVGMSVAKSGRTTGLSCSTVSDISALVNVDIRAECGNPTEISARFSDQIIAANFANYGDSGSLMVDAATARPLGLVASLTTDGLYTGANPIRAVLNALDFATGLQLTFVGGVQHSVSCSSQGPASALTHAVTPLDLPTAELSKALEVHHRHAQSLASDPAVVAVAVGRSQKHPGTAVIDVFVERGRSPAISLPGELDGVEVQIIRSGRFKAVLDKPNGRAVCQSYRHRQPL